MSEDSKVLLTHIAEGGLFVVKGCRNSFDKIMSGEADNAFR